MEIFEIVVGVLAFAGVIVLFGFMIKDFLETILG